MRSLSLKISCVDSLSARKSSEIRLCLEVLSDSRLQHPRWAIDERCG